MNDRIPHRTTGYSISDDDWEEPLVAKAAYIAVTLGQRYRYGGSYGGYRTATLKPNPDAQLTYVVWPMGHSADGMKYRFQWNFPIFFSQA
jgi:hypothetical protein